jgi:hypothetical protein
MMMLRFMLPALAAAALVSGCESYGGGDVGYAGPAYGQDRGRTTTGMRRTITARATIGSG